MALIPVQIVELSALFGAGILLGLGGGAPFGDG
jgi:hypothetical protein